MTLRPTPTLKGSALGFSVLILSLLLFTGITLLSVAVLEKKASFATQKTIIAFQAADSGVERILKRIYIDSSPSYGLVTPGAYPLTVAQSALYDDTLNELADKLDDMPSNALSATCNGGVITATNSNPGTSPAYTFEATFHDDTGAVIGCAPPFWWRDEVVRIRVKGYFERTSRVIEVGIRPRNAGAPVPTNFRATCNGAGNQVTLSWDPVVGAIDYFPRLDYQPNNNVACLDGWHCLSPPDFYTDYHVPTSITYSALNGQPYSAWVHSRDTSGIGLPTVITFSCP